ncbi:MAG: alpha/beta hydrolase-fold protein, partial [Thermoanaerobaculia bacterium]|nr:alpha/beta hydrolase-fold protein [Thermoanaerobaculia bacterium]
AGRSACATSEAFGYDSHMRIRVPLLALALLVSPSLLAAPPFSSLDDLDRAISSVAKGKSANAFWDRGVAERRMPLIFGETAVFLYRGEGKSVEWRGDHVGWRPSEGAKGKRIGRSDVWQYRRSFDLDARIDYKIVVDGERWLLDELNPYTQVGGYGPNSELRMPEWRPSPFVTRAADLPRGTLSVEKKIASKALGYDVVYRVYTPAGLAPDAKKLASLYVTDGSDYWRDDMGALVVVLDNLIASKSLPPLVAVFVDPWDRRNGVNRRETEYVPAQDGVCRYCEFLTAELVPLIDASYPTARSAESRAILGTSLGGLVATVMTTRHHDVFALAGIQSPAYWPAGSAEALLAGSDTAPARAFIDIGSYEGTEAIADAKRAKAILESRGARVGWLQPHDGHSWGHWRGSVDEVLVFLFEGSREAKGERR